MANLREAAVLYVDDLIEAGDGAGIFDPDYPGGSGIESRRQIRFANRFAIST